MENPTGESSGEVLRLDFESAANPSLATSEVPFRRPRKLQIPAATAGGFVADDAVPRRTGLLALRLPPRRLYVLSPRGGASFGLPTSIHERSIEEAPSKDACNI